jgi:hypothetical protein
MTTAAHPRPRRPLSSLWGAWVVVRPLVIAALLGAFATFLAMGGGSSTQSSAPGQNITAGMIDAIRVGDPSACTMATPAAGREIARLLGRSSHACWVAVIRAPAQTRAAAMRPFRGMLGFGTVTESGGTDQGSHEVDWSRTPDGRYAVVAVSSHGADGYLVDSIRIQAREP